MSIKNVTFQFLFSIVFFSYTGQSQSIDFTNPSSFTDGIEGPDTDQEGNVYAVNFTKQGTIGKVTPAGNAAIFVELPNGSIGNGIRFGSSKEMFVADYINHNILKIDMNNKEIEVYAHETKANQPNDLTIARNGTIYASDPNWPNSTGNLWKITKAKGFELLEENMGTTNGVEISNDGSKLFVNESVQRLIWVYDIQPDGGVSNKRQFHAFEDFGLDGMRFNKDGNLFVCRYGKGTVAILSPEGKLLQELDVKGKNPTNITFSPDYKTCYVTVADRGCIEKFDLSNLRLSDNSK
ncbi:MAG: SMP-30/gluconolactonase/LRE family protein [Bacteroidota bacterium]